jgi:HPt (histidine-containing phosphotransfer) domain-containing protein
MATVREFFLTEAREHLRRLDTLLDSGETAAPAELQRLGRGLRGSAQMADAVVAQQGARLLEDVAKSLAAGTLQWGGDVRERLQATVADLRALIEGDGSGEGTRLAALLTRWPDLAAPRAEGRPAASNSAEFRAFARKEADGVLAELDRALGLLEREPLAREPLKALLRRQRVLLGSSQLDALPRLAEVLRSIHDVTRQIARLNVAVDGDWLAAYREAREALRRILPALGGAGEEQADPALARLRALRRSLLERFGEPDDTTPPAGATEDLPIEVLNFFRTEAGALLDRIERMDRELGTAPADRHPNLRREIRTAFTALRDTAGTFGFPEVARTAESALAGAGTASLHLASLIPTLRAIVAREIPTSPGGTESAPAARPTAPAAASPPASAPSRAAPRAAPQPAGADGVVPIDELLYQGEAAIRRALELRPRIEGAVGSDPAAREAVEELFDLLQLGIG